MKVSTTLLTLAAATAATAAAHQHGHIQHHHVKRDVATEVVTVYELDGKPISEDAACGGLAKGKYKWGDGDKHPAACGKYGSPQPGEFINKAAAPEVKKAAAPPKPKPQPKPPVPKAPKVQKPEPSPAGGQGLDSEFPDGQLPCSTFPSSYGPIALSYLGLGGWTGVQHVGDGYIETGTKGSGCTEGAMCSYGCPPGYQKSQWPSTQGATGQSIGGLKCSGGKLHLTNPQLSKNLCMKGVGGVNVQNKLGKHVAVCRTDYPGTESETIPLGANPGATVPLTCPDANNYYSWQGKPTSAQYYVNPAGYSTDEACQWGDKSKPIGNFSPINLGVGQDKNGKKWLAILANKPTTDAKLDYTVEIQGSNLGGSCKYQNGMFHSATGANADGCTVQVMSGDATYVFY